MNEFGSVCERRKLRVKVGKKVIRCSRYGNGGRMHVLLKGEPLDEVDRSPKVPGVASGS